MTESDVKCSMTLGEKPAAIAARPSLLTRHVAWLNRQPMLVFTFLMAVYGFLAQLVLVLVLVVLALAGHSVPSSDWQPSLFASLVAAPLLETFLGQWLPLYITARLKASVRVQVAVSTLVFSLAHLDIRAVQIVPAAFALAYTYVTWRSRGKHKGYWATVLTHFWANCLIRLLRTLLTLMIG